MKTEDPLNRRQKERPLKLGLHDISCAQYFTIGDQSLRYLIKIRAGYLNDYAVYSLANDSRECIGFASPDRNNIIIVVRHHGLDWSTKVKLSDIHIFGSKNPND